LTERSVDIRQTKIAAQIGSLLLHRATAEDCKAMASKIAPSGAYPPGVERDVANLLYRLADAKRGPNRPAPGFDPEPPEKAA
jgi:hypothetical protein